MRNATRFSHRLYTYTPAPPPRSSPVAGDDHFQLRASRDVTSGAGPGASSHFTHCAFCAPCWNAALHMWRGRLQGHMLRRWHVRRQCRRLRTKQLCKALAQLDAAQELRREMQALRLEEKHGCVCRGRRLPRRICTRDRPHNECAARPQTDLTPGREKTKCTKCLPFTPTTSPLFIHLGHFHCGPQNR